MSRSRRADTDFSLVTDLQQGDLAAFSEIVVRYQQVVCAVAFSACGSQALSEDVAQETFVAAWKNIAKLEDSSKLKSWLCSIARNRARDVLRKRRREVLTEDGDGQSVEFQTTTADTPSPLDRAVTVEEEAQLWEALQNIPEGYRETLVLFYRDGQSIHQVAEGLELSVAAVKQRLSRGRAALRDSLGRVSHCLARTQPSKAFTVGVIAAVAAQSGIAAAANAAGAGHMARAKTAAGSGKAGGLFSLGFACMAALILGVSALFIWTLIELAPGDAPQLKSKPAAAPAILGDSRTQRKVLAPRPTSETAKQEFRIEGKVVDLFQQGVAGATVALGGDSQRTATTDEHGNFVFAAVERGAIAIQARSGDGSSRPVSLHVDAETEKLKLQLIEGSTLELQLRDGRGGPALPGIEVNLESRSIVLSATTNKLGRVTFKGITTPENVATVEAAGFASSRLSILLSAEPGVHKRSLFLVRGHALSGVVRNEAGQAIAGAKVTLEGDLSSAREDTTFSDEQGRWSFATVAPEQANLFATHDDYAWASVPVALEGATEDATLDVVLPKGRSAEGRVVYADGSPAAFAMVRSQPSGKPVTADADGNFMIRGLEPRDNGVYAKHKIYGSETESLKADAATQGIRLVLEDHSVRGVVVDSHGKPVMGAQLLLSTSEMEMITSDGPSVRATTLTNSRGEFSLGPVPADANFDLVAAMPRVSPAYLGLDPLHALKVKSGQHGVKIKLEESGSLVGRVVGPDGEAIDEFALIVANYVEALEMEASSPFSATGGEFTLSDIPRGKYVVALVAKGYKPKLIHSVDVRSTRGADLGVVTLKRAATLRGRVVNSAGLGVGGARVVAGSHLQADQSGFRLMYQSVEQGADPFMFTSASDAEVYADSDGYFELSNVHYRRGRFFAAAESAGVGRSELVEVSKAGKGEVILALKATGSVRGKISGQGKDIVVSALRKGRKKLQSPMMASAETNGRDFLISQLTPGTYVFSAHEMSTGADFENGLRVEVVAGQELSLDLEVSTRDLPPWDAEALAAYSEQVDVICACKSEACKLAAQDAISAIESSHDVLTGPDYETLQGLDDKRFACER